ncbi:MAG: bifunctional (p)ppGpp synthetase/guanosine-3',5'-bis(diphosphate) 3'-pyrophosphohydrolase, partial [Deltaproteobacteria bacterium]|jgi:(p)ppGpp synthase/HD superfamily hydrolase|nr:bifunctional (p)ppGpp synthetase/guanosine-3',5'-bis(diphosphate) 3'-pyrophosphohydrolase [Deltaproteobacteria bacterium]
MDLAINCAILHDTVEDTKVTIEDVVRNFGESVARGVLALTKNNNLPKELRMEDSLRRIKAEPAEIWLVKIADRICNLTPELPFHFWNREKCLSYAKEGEQILETLKGASPIMDTILSDRIDLWKKTLLT